MSAARDGGRAEELAGGGLLGPGPDDCPVHPEIAGDRGDGDALFHHQADGFLLELDAVASTLSGHFGLSGLGFTRVVRHLGAGSAGATGEVYLTPNEWRQARRLGASYWLYVVWDCRAEHPRLKMIPNPAVNLVAEEIVEVKRWRIRYQALAGAEGTEWRA